MKRGYSKLLYNQRNKNETIVSVIKRLFGEHIRSRLVRTQNRVLHNSDIRQGSMKMQFLESKEIIIMLVSFSIIMMITAGSAHIVCADPLHCDQPG